MTDGKHGNKRDHAGAERMRRDRVTQLISRFEGLKAQRRMFEATLWQPAMDFVMPQAGPMISGLTPIPGQKRGDKVFDGTPEWACDILVNGLQSGLTPDNYRWFNWRVNAKAGVSTEWLNTQPEVRKYLEDCQNVTFEALAQSNYTQVTMDVYRDLAVFGTAAKYCQFDIRRKISFQKLRLTDVCVVENSQGRVDTLFREFKLSARNALKEWGRDACPDVIKSAVDSGNHDVEFVFMHAVYPREDYDTTKSDRKNLPFASVWIYPGQNVILDEGGYHVFPYSVPRWEKMDPYVPWGRSPAIKALQDMGVLNQIAKTNMKAAHKMVEPPLSIPDGFQDPINLDPGAKNRVTGNGRIEAIVTGLNVPFGIDYQDRQAKAVARHFHTEAFLMATDNPQMTATEVIERRQEKLMLLGPIVGRQRPEHHDADLDSIFTILENNGFFPRPPQILLDHAELLDLTIDPQYTSPLFQALMDQEVQAGMKVYQVAAQVVQMTGRPDAMECLNDEEMVRLAHDNSFAPVAIIKSREEVAQMKAQQAQQQQEQLAMQQAMAAAKTGKDLAGIQTGPEAGQNAVSDLAKAMSMTAQGAQSN